MSRFRIATRLYMLVGLSLLVVSAVLSVMLETSRRQMKEERMALLRSVDEVAQTLVKQFEARETAGTLPRAEAQAAALAALSALRYGDNGYLFVSDLDARIVMHPIKPELDGKDGSGIKDPDGKALFVAFADVARADGQGFVDYKWPKPGVEEPVGKLSHVALFKPWGWVIGNGVYTDDLEAMFWRNAATSVLLAVGGTVLMLAGAFSIIRSVTRPIARLRHVMDRIAEEDFAAEVTDTHRGDEVGSMARTLVALRDSVNIRVQQRLATEAAQSRAIEEERQETERLRLAHAEDLANVVRELGAGLARLADCNIRMTIDEPFAGEFETLRRDFNNSIGTFQATLEEVLRETRLLQDNSEEMKAAADNLSRRTEQQAAALEQTSAALVEVTATVESSAARTQETRSLVGEATECATRSGRVVQDAMSAMQRIEKASNEIGNIIGVIDEIAFQTNLLALNAGVEAARAGDSGKGFAVVAQEVRELAQRSAQAAREIKGLIAHSATEVATGVSLVDDTVKALGQIVDYVSAINGNVDAISTAATEQSMGLREISAAVSDLDQMTQQNAAMVEETTAVSHALAGGAEHLGQLVGRFKLNRRKAPRDPGSTWVRDERSAA